VIRSSRRRTSLALAALLTLAVWTAFPSSASADLYFSPFIALKFGGETTLLDVDAVAGSNDAADKAKKVTWGGGVMWLGSGVLGVEGEVAITPGYFQRDPSQVLSSRVTTLLGNLVLAAPLNLTRESLRPYVSAGWGLMRATSNISPDAGLAYSRNLSAFNLGGGVIGMLSRRTGLRWDLRYLRGIGSGDGDTLTGGARLTYWRASMAVVIRTR
jgi:Outer membrane protein beta-barrel domain